MEFAEIPDQTEWNDDVPYASAFEENDMEAQNNPFYDDNQQEEPKKKRDRTFSKGKKRALLDDDEEIVHATPVKSCCCHPLTIGISAVLVLILICAAIISGFIVSDTIAKANVKKTPCTDKQTGDACIMSLSGSPGVCKLHDSKFINDGKLICDDVTEYEKACQQKDSDDTCMLEGLSIPGKCMYQSTTAKDLICYIPSDAELACLDGSREPKKSGNECQLSADGDDEKGTCEVVSYSRMKQCIIPDPDEEICASMKRKDSCTTSRNHKGTCQQMMDNQLKCVEAAPIEIDMRIVTVIAVCSGIILLGLITFGICCYCRQKS